MSFEVIVFLEAACCLQLVSNKLKILVAGSCYDQPYNTSRLFFLPIHPPLWLPGRLSLYLCLRPRVLYQP